MDKQQVTEALSKLSDNFHVTYTLHWHHGTKRAFARSAQKQIHLGPKALIYRGINTVLHEFAHLLDYTRNGRVIVGKRRSIHGATFQKALWDVVTFWFEDASNYSWEAEYDRVRSYGHRKVESLKKQQHLSSMKEIKPEGGKENMFTIEKGIPIPEATRKGKTEKYQFSKMEVNDSIFVPADENSAVNIVDRVKHAAYSAETRIEKKTGSKVRFVVRPDVKDGVNGARVWRTADSE